LGGFHKKVT